MFSCYKPLKVIMGKYVAVSALPFLGKSLRCTDKYCSKVTQTSAFLWLPLALGISDWRYLPCFLLLIVSHGDYLVLSTLVGPWSSDSASYLYYFQIVLGLCLSVFGGLQLNGSGAIPECRNEQHFIQGHSCQLISKE